MGVVDDLIAALTAAGATIREARDTIQAAADSYADTWALLAWQDDPDDF